MRYPYGKDGSDQEMEPFHRSVAHDGSFFFLAEEEVALVRKQSAIDEAETRRPGERQAAPMADKKSEDSSMEPEVKFEARTKEGRLGVAAAEAVEKCNCRKSKCLKLYCECFSRGNFCKKECKCEDCHNKAELKDVRDLIVQETMEKNSLAFRPKFKTYNKQNTNIHARGCTCRRTECIKSYCECFRAGVGCTRLCKCNNCKNQQVALEDQDVPVYYEKILRKRKKPNFLYDLYFRKTEEPRQEPQSGQSSHSEQN